jgi:F-type H+-transporting ATPase subunit gamma
MASGKELRRRIQSVKNTQQITKAMKMVSAAKLRRAQDAIVHARPYAVAIRKATQLAAANPYVREAHPLFQAKPVKKVNVILMTSDRGLCGGYNSNLCKRAEKLHREEAKGLEVFSFTCIGKRGYDFLRSRKIPVRKFYADIQKSVSFAKAAVVADEITEAFSSGEFDEIRLIFAEFRSALSQTIVVDTLLPIANTEFGELDIAAKSDFIFEPEQAEVLNDLLPRYLRTAVFRALLEGAASEHGARMAAMDSATRNAGEVIQKLKLLYNNVRQANITRELLEITAGAEAL